jgi:hypothetical protein
MNIIKAKIKEWLIYFICDSIQIGGHCGICGKWIPNKLYPRFWAIGICDECLKEE